MKRFMMVASIVSIVFCLVGFASAADSVINYNGNFCRATLPGDANSFRTDALGITNVSGHDAWLTCPVLVDEVTSLNGALVSISWTPLGPIEMLDCSFFIGEGSTPKASYYKKFGSGTGYFPVMTQDYSIFSTYCLHCLLPRGATLHRIRVQERM